MSAATSTLRKRLTHRAVQEHRRECKRLDHLLGNGHLEGRPAARAPELQDWRGRSGLGVAQGRHGFLRPIGRLLFAPKFSAVVWSFLRAPLIAARSAERVWVRWPTPRPCRASGSNTFERCGPRFCHAVIARDQRSWPSTPGFWPLARFQLSSVLFRELVLVLEIQLVQLERCILFFF